MGANGYVPRALTTKTTATNGEENKVAESATRVDDVNALLRLENAPPWVPSFEFRPFVLDSHVALGKETLAIVQKIAEKRADRSPMSVDLCKRFILEGRSITIHFANARMIRTRSQIHS